MVALVGEREAAGVQAWKTPNPEECVYTVVKAFVTSLFYIHGFMILTVVKYRVDISSLLVWAN